MRRGQAMMETVLAVLFITIVFLGLFQIAHMVTARILLDHAACRAARARAVGFNDFMCLKSARVAMIPVAGSNLLGALVDDDGNSIYPKFDELSRIPDYLCAENEDLARAILEYERWNTMDFWVKSGDGLASTVSAGLRIDIPRFFVRDNDDNSPITMDGKAEVESHYPLYMYNQGL